MSEMRLLMVVPEKYPVFRADVQALFGRHLPRFNVFSDIVAMKGTSEQTHPWGGGQSFLVIGAAVSALSHLLMFFHVFKNTLLANSKQYDAIQVRDMPILAFMVLIIAKLKGVPFYYWCSYPIAEGQINRAKWANGLIKRLLSIPLLLRGLVGRFFLTRVVFKYSDHLFVQSEHMKNAFGDRGVPLQKMTAVSMGVDLAEIDQTQQQRKQPNTLVYLGTLDPIRQLETLLQAVALVKDQIPDVTLHMIGDTRDADYKKSLHQRAIDLGLEHNINWTGWLSMAEAWQWVSTAQCAYSPIPLGPILDMGSPTKVPEYMALGAMVIGNENPDQRAVIEASGAGLCVPYTPESFANATIKLLSETAEQKNKRADSGKSYVARFRDYSMIADQVAQIYKGLLLKPEKLN